MSLFAASLVRLGSCLRVGKDKIVLKPTFRTLRTFPKLFIPQIKVTLLQDGSLCLILGLRWLL